MSLQIRDGISPAIVRLTSRARNRKPILEAMGLEFVSLTKRAFTDPGLRPLPWRDKVDGTPATLRKSGAMWQSIRVAQVTNDSVTAASDRPYAAIHQFGGKTGKGGKVTMPPRPFFPVLNGKLTPLAAQRIGAVAKAKALSLMK
jgi:phage gpG-like protein